MADRPIIFSGPMVRALLDGRKTQTRRIIKPRPYDREGNTVDINIASSASYRRGADGRMYFAFDHPRGGPLTAYVAHYAPGDRLWAREAWFDATPHMDAPHFWNRKVPLHYRADGDDIGCHRWRPSIHMPRRASRLTLTVTDVRVQRLQQISKGDAAAEGIARCTNDPRRWARYCGLPWERGWFDPVTSFKHLWSQINGWSAWDTNPWVVAVTFTVGRYNIDAGAGDRRLV